MDERQYDTVDIAFQFSLEYSKLFALMLTDEL